jgi:hypothetical protein
VGVLLAEFVGGLAPPPAAAAAAGASVDVGVVSEASAFV